MKCKSIRIYVKINIIPSPMVLTEKERVRSGLKLNPDSCKRLLSGPTVHSYAVPLLLTCRPRAFAGNVHFSPFSFQVVREPIPFAHRGVNVGGLGGTTSPPNICFVDLQMNAVVYHASYKTTTLLLFFLLPVIR